MPLIQSMVLLKREISGPAPQKRGCFYMAHGAFSRHGEVNLRQLADDLHRNGVLFVNSISMNTPFNEAPNFVRSRVTEKPVNRPENMNPAEKPERNDHGEVKDMDIKTTDDLRKAYPDLVASIENEATTAERTRIQEIENATLPGAEDQANEAKFTKPVDSASFAKAVIASMKAKQQEQSKKYLKNAKEAAENSNANSIDNTPPANPEAEDEESKAFMNAIRKANGVK